MNQHFSEAKLAPNTVSDARTPTSSLGGPWPVPAERQALAMGSRSWTYGELERACAKVACFLSGLNLEPGGAVGVALPPGCDLGIAVLGVFRAGFACLPLPADAETVRFFGERGMLAAVLTQSRMMSQLSGLDGIGVYDLDRIDSPGGSGGDTEPASGAPALILPVPGPAAVSLRTLQLTETVGALSRMLDIRQGERICRSAPGSAAALLIDLLLGLAAGGTLVLPAEEDERTAAGTARLLASEKVTVWHTTPGLAQRLTDHLSAGGAAFPEDLQAIALSGDWVPGTLAGQLSALNERLRIFYLSGSEESGVFHAINQGASGGDGTLFLGSALTGRIPRVLNERGEPCPPWVPGRLFIGGGGLARAWPPSASPPERMVPSKQGEGWLFATDYRARLMPDGFHIELLGREENHLEIQGGDVFAHQVEHALTAHGDIRHSVVVAASAEGPPVAFLVPRGELAPDKKSLDAFLSETLPEYAVPARYITMERIPLDEYGAVDRRALRAVAANAVEPEPAAENRAAKASTGAVSYRFGEKIAALMNVPSVDPDANLLDLGINSVDLIRIANDLEAEFGFRPDLETFFREPTIEALALQYEVALGGASSFQEPFEPAVPTEKDRNPSQIIMDPDAREEFKKARQAFRRDLAGKPRVRLETPEIDDGLRVLYARRSSVREFLLNPVPLESFSGFLAVLREIELQEQPKYRYASAGGLYPVQTYLYVKPGRVQGLEAGTYYYHPIEHELTRIHTGADLHRDTYGWINKPIFDQGGFCLFLVSRMKAIEPMYGNLARDFSLYEAGSMGQLLMAEAPDYSIGLCGIGALRQEDIRPLLGLEEGQEVLHSFIGGLIDPDRPSAAEGESAKHATKQEKIARMLEKMERLSSEEVKALLEEKKKTLNR